MMFAIEESSKGWCLIYQLILSLIVIVETDGKAMSTAIFYMYVYYHFAELLRVDMKFMSYAD